MAKLTRKQKIFVDEYLETGNGTQSALKAYDTEDPNTARSIASENLTKPAIRAAVEEAFPDSELFSLHREGLYDEDLHVRHKYLESAYKLKGSYAPEKSVNLNANVNVSSDIQELADAAAELLKKKKL